MIVNVRRSALAVAGLLAILTACGQGTSDEAELEEVSSEGNEATDADGGSPTEIRIVTTEDPPTLESAYGYSATTGLVLRNIQEPLVGRDADTGEFVPLLAESWEQVDENTWHFKIREGVKFHDGSPLDAEAAAFGVNLNWDEEQTSTAILGFRGPKFVAQAVDEYTMEIVTESPDPILPNRMWLALLPSKKHIDENGIEAWRQEPIGTGPYEFVSWDPAQQIELRKNEDWWGFDSEDGDGEPYFDRAIYDIRADQSSVIAAFAAGEAQLAPRLPATMCTSELGDNCVQSPDINVIHVRFDHMNPLLGDIRIREAINLAIDREAIGQEIVPGPPAADLTIEGVVGHNPDIQVSPYDPDRARELIAEAAADGVPVDQQINFRVERGKFPGIDEAALAVQAMIEEVGLNVDFAILDPAVFLEQAVDPERPIDPERAWIILHQANNPLADYSVIHGLWYGCEAVVSTYCNEELDALVEQALPIVGPERAELFSQAAMMAAEDYAFAPVVQMGLFHGVDPSLSWDIRADTHVYLKNIRPAN